MDTRDSQQTVCCERPSSADCSGRNEVDSTPSVPSRSGQYKTDGHERPYYTDLGISCSFIRKVIVVFFSEWLCSRVRVRICYVMGSCHGYPHHAHNSRSKITNLDCPFVCILTNHCCTVSTSNPIELHLRWNVGSTTPLSPIYHAGWKNQRECG